MTTPTARDLPGRVTTSTRVAICLAVTLLVGAAGAYWADQRTGMLAARAGAVSALVVPLLVAAAVIVVWLAVHRRRGREPVVAPVGRVTAPPSEHAPATVGWLLRYGTTVPEDIAATLLDLLDRGAIAVDATTGSLRPATRDGAVPLAAHEHVVLGWLFGDRGVLPVEDRTAEIAADPRSWQTLWDDFTTAVGDAARTEGFVERTAAAEEVMSVGLLSSGVIVAGAVGMARGYPAWLACIAAGAVVLVFADTLARRSPAGAELAARWRAFCAYLSTAGADARVMPHAVALGLDAGAALSPEQRLIVSGVQRWHRAYVTASAFLTGPSVSLRNRARSGAPH